MARHSPPAAGHPPASRDGTGAAGAAPLTEGDLVRLARATTEHNPLAVYWFAKDGRFLYVNEQACRVLGYTRDELLVRCVSDIDPGQVPAVWEQSWNRLLEHGTGVLESTHRTKDGRSLPVEIYGTLLRVHDREFVCACARDLTDQRHAEEAVSEQIRLLSVGTDVGTALAGQDPIDLMLQRCAEALVTHLDAAFARIWTVEPPEQILQLRASAGIYRHRDGKHGRVPIGQYKIGKIAESGQAILTNQVVGDPNVHDQEWARREGMVAFAGHPLVVGDETIGVVALFSRRTLNASVVRVLASVADQIAVGIERARITAELRSSEATLQSVFRSAPTGIGLVVDRVIQWGNDKLCEIIGWDAEDLVGQSARILYPDDAEYEFVGREKYEQISRQGTGSVETVWRRKDGRLIDVLLSSCPIETGDPSSGVTFTALDITGRLRAERENAQLATAIEQAAESVIVTDTSGSIIYANPEFERVTGYSRQEVLGKTPRLLKSGKQDRAFYDEMWNTLLRGKSWNGQLINRKKDGTLFHEQAAISPIRGGDGKALGFVAVKRDTTEQVRLEEQLAQAQKMEAVGQLAGGVAHDFNNILQAIQGYTEMALRDMPSEARGRSHLGQVIRATERASSLVRQLLAFSRADRSEPQTLNLNQALEDLLNLLRRLIGEQIELVVDPEPDLRPVQVDPAQVEQVVMNLCLNARDAMPDGGCITLRTRNVRFTRSECAVRPWAREGDFVLLSLVDTGCGIPPEILGRVFEPFFTTKEVGEGTGLGLATVYAVVTRTEGLLNVESQPGKGTTFSVYLPAGSE